MWWCPKKAYLLQRFFDTKVFPLHGFDVFFNPPAHLKKNTRYRLEASISGPPCLMGIGGLDTVKSSDVTFQFFSSVDFLDYGTNRSAGQFLEFIFCEVTY